VPTEMPIPRALDDYSVGNNMCDYRMAYTETRDMSSKLEHLYASDGRFSMQHEDLVKVRADMDKMLSSREEYLQLFFKTQSSAYSKKFGSNSDINMVSSHT